MDCNGPGGRSQLAFGAGCWRFESSPPSNGSRPGASIAGCGWRPPSSAGTAETGRHGADLISPTMPRAYRPGSGTVVAGVGDDLVVDSAGLEYLDAVTEPWWRVGVLGETDDRGPEDSRNRLVARQRREALADARLVRRLGRPGGTGAGCDRSQCHRTHGEETFHNLPS